MEALTSSHQAIIRTGPTGQRKEAEDKAELANGWPPFGESEQADQQEQRRQEHFTNEHVEAGR